ncbi:hypothetical protein [Nonomuraea glycinis]|jgi:hypothetical protein|uniref:hypothetical protein n=1 Tax=Nonomuraea glycinis TaxID=2047744 RepID=UPI0033A24F22
MPHAFAAILIAASMTAAAPASAAQSAATTAPNYRACYDGTCKITLTKKASFRVHPRFGITRLTITFNSRQVRVKGTGPGVTAGGGFSKGGAVTVNGIQFTVTSLSGKKAVLRLKARR